MSDRIMSYVFLLVAFLLPLMVVIGMHHDVTTPAEIEKFLHLFLFKGLVFTSLIMYLSPIRIPWYVVLLVAFVIAVLAFIKVLIVDDVGLFLEMALYLLGLGALIKYIYTKKLL